MYKRHARPQVLGMFLAMLVSSWSVSACAQKAGGGSAGLRTAGNSAKFRVIKRFPAKAPTAEEVLAGQGKAAVDDAVRDAIDQQRFDVAHLLVEKAGTKHDPFLTLLDGYLTYRAGEPKKALPLLESVAGKVPNLEDYRLFWTAQAAFDADKAQVAVLSAARVPRNSRLFGQSLILLANALTKAGTDSDLKHAVETLRLYLAKYPHGRSAPDARLLLAQTLEQTKQWDQAAKAYLAVLDEDAVGDGAQTARERLKAIRAHLSKAVRQAIDHPPLDQRMERYRVLFAHHRSQEVIDALEKEIAGIKKDDPHRCEAMYLVARSHSKLRQHTEGAKWYKRILDECGHTHYAIKALYLGGKGLWNAGKRDQARKWFQRIWSKFAKHSFADDAMYFVARILREEKKPAKARALLKKQVARYPDGDMAKDAHWLLVRQMFAKSDYQGVVDYVDALKDTGEDDIYSRGRLHYFRARALELLEKDAKARAAYQKVITSLPLSYYAYLAFNRLGAMAATGNKGGHAKVSDVCSLHGGKLCDFVEPARSPGVVLGDDLRQAVHFKRGAALLRLGLTDLAEDEFQALLHGHGGDANLWALSYLLDAAHAYRLSHDLPRRQIHGWKTQYPKDSDDPRWSLAFPTPFRDLVDKYAKKRKLRRALVYAIMREESGFNPRIESWANARGLLQLMEATGRHIAQQDGLANFSADDLLDPAINIRLGTGYIAELSGQLAAHPALIIAGYNAGYANVSRWLKKRGDLPLDLWVEDIPYGQTRKYTKRVLASFWTYSWMYGHDRVPRLSFKLRSK